MPIAIREITVTELEAHREDFLRIHLEAFTAESYSHNQGKLDEEESFAYCREILTQKGTGLFAFDGERLAGFLLARPLKYDAMLNKAGLRDRFDVERCHYLAELAVDREFRGQKLGHRLVEAYLRSVKDRAPILVRTNESESRLLAFYESLGFAYEDVRAEQHPGIWKRYFVFRPTGDGTIQFYGERGLVNAAFLDLKTKGMLAAFLRSIEFPSGPLPIADGADITVIIEAGFGGNKAGFGWPDAVISAKSNGNHFVLFMEAKAGLYQNEAKDFTAVRAKGFNSTINGQFSLRYRLAEALKTYREGSIRLVEHPDLARAYDEERFPRRLAKEENLREIVEPHLIGTPKYLLVALTDDDTNPWRVTEGDAMELLPYLAAPVDPGNPAPKWTVAGNQRVAHRERFGWVGFRKVEEFVGDGEFFKLASSFLAAKRRQTRRGGTGPVEPGEPTGTANWDYAPNPAATIPLRDAMRHMIKAEAKAVGLRYKRGDGSDSVIGSGDRRLLKLIAPIEKFPGQDILLGVAVGLGGFPEYVRNRRLRTIRIKKRGFEIVGINQGDFSPDLLRELIRDTISNATDNRGEDGEP